MKRLSHCPTRRTRCRHRRTEPPAPPAKIGRPCFSLVGNSVLASMTHLAALVTVLAAVSPVLSSDSVPPVSSGSIVGTGSAVRPGITPIATPCQTPGLS